MREHIPPPFRTCCGWHRSRSFGGALCFLKGGLEVAILVIPVQLDKKEALLEKPASLIHHG